MDFLPYKNVIKMKLCMYLLVSYYKTISTLIIIVFVIFFFWGLIDFIQIFYLKGMSIANQSHEKHTFVGKRSYLLINHTQV